MKALFSPREVEVFAAVMRHGTATKAAETLDISQPAVSKVLAQFQRKAGFELFRKQRQRLIPTHEAQMLFVEVERSFVSVREIARAARDIRDLRTGRLNIGALPGIGLTLLPGAITRFLKQHPTISVTLNVRASPTVIEWTGRNQVDLSVAVTTAIENPAIVGRALPAVPGVCVVPVDHPLAKSTVVQAADLEGEEFISLAPSDPLRLQLDSLCEQKSIRRHMTIDSPIANSAIGFVSHGAGIAIIDCVSAWFANWPNVIVRPFEPLIEIEMSMYRPRGMIASAVTNAFMESFLRDFRENLEDIERSIINLDGKISRPCSNRQSSE